MNSVKTGTYKIYVFYCSNSVVIEGFREIIPEKDFENRYISLPCSGKVNLLYLIKAFETGADGIILMTCPKGECRFLEGNLRAPKRAENVNSLLEEIGMGRERVLVLNPNGSDRDDIVSRITNFYSNIKNA